MEICESCGRNEVENGKKLCWDCEDVKIFETESSSSLSNAAPPTASDAALFRDGKYTGASRTDYSTGGRVAKSVGGGVYLIVGSLVLFIIPVIGWILGAIGLLLGIGMLCGGATPAFILKGNCPYCAKEISVHGPKDAVTCGACKKRIVIKDDKFYLVT